MSSVRMCDKCQNVFSELDLGWQTYEAVTNDEDDDGRRFSKSVRMDACPECAIAPPSRRARKVAQLEREAGVAVSDPFTPLTDVEATGAAQ